MTQRITAAIAILALVLTATLATRPAPAQGTAAAKGLFGNLKVGQMIEVAPIYQDQGQTMTLPMYAVRIYDDPAAKTAMNYKVTEIADGHLGVQFNHGKDPGEVTDIRIPTHSVMAIFHVKTPKKGSGKKS